MWRVRAGGAADSFHHPGTALETQAAIKGALGQLGAVQGELLSWVNLKHVSYNHQAQWYIY